MRRPQLKGNPRSLSLKLTHKWGGVYIEETTSIDFVVHDGNGGWASENGG